MKLCKDCRWHHKRDDEQPLCDHPTSVAPARVSLFTGERIPAYQYTCADMRYFNAWGAFCGSEGRHWEAADTAPTGFA